MHTYYIAGHTFRLEFAGPALVPQLTPALAHLHVPASTASPDFTIRLWDSASTGVPPLTLPRGQTTVGLRGEVPALSDDQILTAVQRDVNAVSVWDRRTNVGFYWIDSLRSLRAYERAAPLKVLLHWWLRTQGLWMIHAGAVGTADGVALLMGKTGAGKSTTTLACLAAGMHYMADDRCLLALEPEPTAYCLYNSAKLYLDQMRRFPAWMSAVHNLDDVTQAAQGSDKALVHVHEFAPDQLAARRPIRALLLAQIAHAPVTTLSPVPRMRLLRDFVTSTLVYQPGAGQAEIHSMTELVRRVPCYQLNLGVDLAQIPQPIQALLQATPARA